jgi:hypothetical protein
MVRFVAARAVTMATLVILAFVPVTAGSQGTTANAPTVYHYSTTITPQYGSQYPIAGHLDLQIFPDGIVRGYYHNAHEKRFVPISGGRDGTYLWFNIGPAMFDLDFLAGPSGTAHVVATVSNDNSFRGQIYPEVTARSNLTTMSTNGQLNITNLPSANNMQPFALATPSDPVSAEQYIFSAKLIEKSSEDYPGT